jgi:rhamnulokinase
MTSHYLAVDLGAESGRVMLGTLAEGLLTFEEIHRFPNGIVTRGKGLFWDLAHLEKEIFTGFDKVARRNVPVSGISADSWGLDYVLLDAEGNSIVESRCYRDPRNAESLPRVLKKLPSTELYAETGIQLLAINTLFQLEAEKHDPNDLLSRADRLLLIADYFNARFSGVSVAEQSLASTTQLYDPRRHAWSKKIISTLGLPEAVFPRIVPSGTVLGPVTKDLRQNQALAHASVIATCSHDTGAAIAALPTQSKSGWAYLSSGTWSLLGTELTAPIMTEAAREAGFTNEVGLGGSIQFLKNIVGLWIIQECCRFWQTAGQSYSYDELTQLAKAAGSAGAHINVDDPRFLSPGQMPEKVATFCRETNQPAPTSPGQIIRTVLESLALFYARTLAQLEKVTGRKYEILHVVGGGSRNDFLNQLTASAAGIAVMAGPVEATAIGNILIQALALRQIESADRLRSIVAASFPTRLFQPAQDFPETVKTRFSQLFN